MVPFVYLFLLIIIVIFIYFGAIAKRMQAHEGAGAGVGVTGVGTGAGGTQDCVGSGSVVHNLLPLAAVWQFCKISALSQNSELHGPP